MDFRIGNIMLQHGPGQDSIYSSRQSRSSLSSSFYVNSIQGLVSKSTLRFQVYNNIVLLSVMIFKFLELDKRTKLLYQSKTQENSVKSSIQSKLPYIPIVIVHANYCTLYPKPPCIRHEINIQYTYYIMLFFLEPSMSFFLCHMTNPNPKFYKQKNMKSKLKIK